MIPSLWSSYFFVFGFSLAQDKESSKLKNIALSTLNIVVQRCEEVAHKYSNLPFSFLYTPNFLWISKHYDTFENLFVLLGRYCAIYLPMLLEACNDENCSIREVFPTASLVSFLMQFSISNYSYPLIFRRQHGEFEFVQSLEHRG